MTLTEARDHYRLTATRHDGVYLGHMAGKDSHWRILVTDDCGDVDPTGPIYLTKGEAFAELSGTVS